MKVLRLITRLNVGGPARQVLALQKEMARLGIDETLATGYVDEGEADLAQMLGEKGFLRIESLVRPVRPARDIRAYQQIVRLIRTLKPDIVHTHMSKAGLLGRVAALRCKVPVTVHTFHGHVLDAYFSSSTGRLIKGTERAIGRRTAALLAVGEGVREDLIAYGVAPPGRIQVVPAGIDLSPFADIGEPGGPLRRSLGIPDGASVVGFAGRFVPVKRIDRLVDAAREVARILPNSHFIVCGDGPDRPLLTEAAAASPLAGRLHLMGSLSDLRTFYEAVDVVILTSANEGTPISLIEAGASARPVISTRVGGVADVVKDGSTGYLVAPDGEGMAKAIVDLLGATNHARRMGAAGRERVLARYTAGRLSSDLVSIYQRELAIASQQSRT